ncbi:aminodeoxychorismate synthase, component I [Actinophytocola xinjiangensis]|uniref:aminodeoxychorismate synthase n=1 Tax=Actinophytocola xinjiangensis TaxID=485602 RepID=A0A7Z1AYW0_9PSEU|nr:aminodeoxychorismate synthase component I [Actinophytocola xinjiangensis]OLF11105.1 aminodeoxychorismate synthase, component I [Actinophytocola xinjiangensis]
MRTLVVDNHDSFTVNLVHLVGAVTGARPDVVRNDQPGWAPADLAGYDNVIISPGPGRPDRPADFGVCGEIIRAGTRPLLGVCLGHQGICHAYGGVVGPAPEPRHGLVSRIHHDRAGIFAGLPSPFTAVRYHSLAVSGLPADLEAVASAEDGVLMAVRHRTRPQWGVQFHPESIHTEHGHRLLANFLGERGSIPVRGPRRRPAAPTLLHRRLDTDVEAEAVFDALYRESAWAFWLDSAAGGRFSFLGDASGPLARVATADVAAGEVTVRSRDGDTVVRESFLDWLAADLADGRADLPAGLPFDFALGWVGHLGYELKAECGGDIAHRADAPDAAMISPDRAVVVDHHERAVHLLAVPHAHNLAWLADTEATLTGLGPLGEHPPAPELGALRARHDRAGYLDLIARSQAEIVAGESYEVCLTNQLVADGKLDPWPAYRRLRRDNPEPFAALLRLGERSVLSASPERFLRVSPDGLAESRPIKGTRPRGESEMDDQRLRAELAASAKDRAENLMIVDLVRNDLGVVAELGSVSVPELFAVETHPTVHQLVSTVRARLRADATAVDCVRAAFPGGSMTGAPKKRTMEIIDRLEGGPRGVYSGALGYFSRNGAADFSIVIRTLVVEPDRVSYGVGGAVIALSDPDGEVAETAVKATPLLRLLDQEFPE